MSHKHKRISTSGQALFKLIMVGNSAAGKSSLLTRYTRDIFENEYQVTVGVEFASKLIQIDESCKIKLQIWDTAGQESFKSIIKSYYRNSASVVLVYDITRKQSFESLNSWKAEAKENSPENVMYVLIGTHLDQASERQVPKETAEKWMKDNNIALFFETSSKTSENVVKAFEEVGKQLFHNRITTKRLSVMPMETNQTGRTVLSNQVKEPEKQKCCAN